MKIRLSVSTIWTVNPQDISTAKFMLEHEPIDAIWNLIADSFHQDKELSEPRASAVEILEDGSSKTQEGALCPQKEGPAGEAGKTVAQTLIEGLKETGAK